MGTYIHCDTQNPALVGILIEINQSTAHVAQEKAAKPSSFVNGDNIYQRNFIAYIFNIWRFSDVQFGRCNPSQQHTANFLETPLTLESIILKNSHEGGEKYEENENEMLAHNNYNNLCVNRFQIYFQMYF